MKGFKRKISKNKIFEKTVYYFTIIVLVFMMFGNVFVSYSKYTSNVNQNNNANIALFDVQLSKVDNLNNLVLSGIDNPLVLYEFTINNNSDVSVTSDLIIELENVSRENDIDSLHFQIIEKESEEIFEPLEDSSSIKKYFKLGDMMYHTNKEYYLKILLDDYKKLTKKQQLSIHVKSLISQID